MDKKIILEEMSWVEVRDAIQSGRDSVIICAGVVEQHGPQLPLNTDTVLGQYGCIKIAEQMQNMLVGPPLNFGVTWNLRDFPGTVHLRDETMIQLLIDYIDSLIRAGFKNIIFLCQHGSNVPALQAVIYRYNLEKKARVMMIQPWGYVPEGIGPLFNRQVGFHANETETSMMLHVAPELVQMDKAEGVVEIPDAPSIRDQSYRFLVQVYSPRAEPGRGGAWLITKTGAFGTPSKATREFGEKLVEGYIKNIVKDLRVILSD